MAVISHRNLKIKSYQAIIILLLQLVVQENCIKTYILHSSSSLKRFKSHRRTKNKMLWDPKVCLCAVCGFFIFSFHVSLLSSIKYFFFFMAASAPKTEDSLLLLARRRLAAVLRESLPRKRQTKDDIYCLPARILMRLIIEISRCAPTNLESGTKSSRDTISGTKNTPLCKQKTHPPFKSLRRRNFLLFIWASKFELTPDELS